MMLLRRRSLNEYVALVEISLQYQTKSTIKSAPKTAKNPKLSKGSPAVSTPSPGSIVAPYFVVNESLVIPPVSNVETPLPIIGLSSPLVPLASIIGPKGPAGPVGPKGTVT